MRTRKAASLLLSLLLMLGLLSGAAGALAHGAAETGTAPEAGAEIGPRRQLLHNEAGGPSGPRGRLRRGQLQPEATTVCLQTDLDLAGSDFASIPTFGGVFEGGGHTISGLSLTANRSHTGFFRYIQPGAVVKELNLSGEVKPGGSAQYAGGLAGNNAGSIRDCSFTGTVEALTSTGGLVGANEESGSIKTAASPAPSRASTTPAASRARTSAP